MFRPPVLRNVATAGAKAIDRSLFARKYPISAAKVFDKKNIGKYRTAFEKSQDILRIERVPSVVNDADGDKCVLLQPAVKPDDESSWSEVLKAAVRTGEAKVIPWELTLGYEYWNYCESMPAE
jgi:tRNA (guanine37-N1)-methyltransferase